MPEMSVVRFTESDVIVASAGFRLIQYGNGVEGDGYVLYNNQKYGTRQPGGSSFPTALYDDFNNDNPGVGFSDDTNFHWQNGSGTWSTQNFAWIYGQDNTDASSSVDGYYHWSGTEFVKQ